MKMHSTLKIAAWVMICGISAAIGAVPHQDEPAIEQAIMDLLKGQEAAWNVGDLEAFLEGYWKDPQLTFFSGNSIREGWESTRSRYIERYQSENREMGKLRFQDLVVSVLGPTEAFVRGRYRLEFTTGEENSGLFTLIIRAIDGQWRIVHDHTSSE